MAITKFAKEYHDKMFPLFRKPIRSLLNALTILPLTR